MGQKVPKFVLSSLDNTEDDIPFFILCHRKYSQSEYRKAVVYSTVLNPTFPSCAAFLFLTKFSERIFYGMV